MISVSVNDFGAICTERDNQINRATSGAVIIQCKSFKNFLQGNCESTGTDRQTVCSGFAPQS